MLKMQLFLILGILAILVLSLAMIHLNQPAPVTIQDASNYFMNLS